MLRAIFGCNGSWVSSNCAAITMNYWDKLTIVQWTRLPPSEWPSTIFDKPIDLFLGCFYDHILPPEVLSRFKIGAVNLHPSFLPWNRGRHSTFWGIMDGTPLGSSIHWMDEKLDHGPIIGRKDCADDGIMPASKAYDMACQGCVDLYAEYLPHILAGRGNPTRWGREPGIGPGSFHNASDIKAATYLPWESRIGMAELIRLIRATSFGDHGFYTLGPGRRVYKIKGSVERGEDWK